MAKETIYVGVNDHEVDYFEGIYVVPNGVSYNSYVIRGEKTAVMDAVDARFSAEWLDNVKKALGGKKPDYLVILHMEPDHSGSILEFVREYPSVTLVGNQKTFVMLGEYFDALGADSHTQKLTVKDGESLDLGGRVLKFVFAPLVHWPEVMLAYESEEKALYSADAFGKFGALDCDEPWDDEARRYYIGIVGKYGVQVTAALKKLSGLDIKIIRPLHGPVLTDTIPHCIDLYTKWANYIPEKPGVMIAYTSIYGHTKAAAELIKSELDKRGVKNEMFDLVRSDRADCVARAFAYGTIVLATTTYNGEAFPAMREFVDHLVERGYRDRKVAIIENGTWSPHASVAINARLEKCKNISYVGEPVKIHAALNNESRQKISELADMIKLLDTLG